MSERYLSVVQVAELLGTTVRFPRRLVAERRIRYVKVGTHVRIPESAVQEYIAANTVEPRRPQRSRYRRAA
ncbi:excisionase family DNA-binding protein [Streptomyces xanthophaeus]|uniref:DNA-binding protein n=1 Tax=Streptomyces xanthophaeus TaxID=67385 RepID=A0A919LLN6_9ACTN|nr:excisionase family DNA-binding protein [Streptomyces xanthophaeus]GHI88774.1 DNA-binding protein [Streptomyces xanthophaeus]